jgi:hypothetical protein
MDQGRRLQGTVGHACPWQPAVQSFLPCHKVRVWLLLCRVQQFYPHMTYMRVRALDVFLLFSCAIVGILFKDQPLSPCLTTRAFHVLSDKFTQPMSCTLKRQSLEDGK